MTAGAPTGPMSFPAYRRMFAARAVSSAGSYMQVVAASWLVFHLTQSAAAVGVLTALALGPAIVGGPIGGALVDRHDPRKLALGLSLAQAVPCALLALVDVAGDITVAWLYVLVLAGAIPFSINQPVITLVAPYTVPPEFRRAAVARTSMIFNVTRLLGAFLGGALVTAAGPGLAFGINAASYFVVALVLASVRLQPDVAQRSSRKAPSVVGGVKAGWTLPLMRLVAVGVAAFFTLVAPIEQLMPTVAQEHGQSATSVGVLIGCIAVGALVANPFLGRSGRSGRHRQMALGLVVAAMGLATLALTPNSGLVIDVVATMAIGFGWEFVFVSGQGAVAVDLPADMRGSLMGLFFFLVTATTALGSLVVGYLLDALGLTAALLINAAVVLAGAVVLLLPRFGKVGAAPHS